jgi:hypothetical protein
MAGGGASACATPTLGRELGGGTPPTFEHSSGGEPVACAGKQSSSNIAAGTTRPPSCGRRPTTWTESDREFVDTTPSHSSSRTRPVEGTESADKVGRVHAQPRRQAHEDHKGRVLAASLESADVGPIQAAAVGQTLLGDTGGLPYRSKATTELGQQWRGRRVGFRRWHAGIAHRRTTIEPRTNDRGLIVRGLVDTIPGRHSMGERRVAGLGRGSR